MSNTLLLPPMSEIELSKARVKSFGNIQKMREENYAVRCRNSVKKFHRYWLSVEFFPGNLADDIFEIISFDDIPLPYSEKEIQDLINQMSSQIPF